jgi:hypothetical protein
MCTRKAICQHHTLKKITEFSGENEEDTQMNEGPNEDVPVVITPSESRTLVQRTSFHQSK